MNLLRLSDGGYKYGFFIIRKDQPIGEWDLPSGKPVWYVLTLAQDENRDGLPDAYFEAATLRECKTWCDNQLKKEVSK